MQHYLRDASRLGYKVSLQSAFIILISGATGIVNRADGFSQGAIFSLSLAIVVAGLRIREFSSDTSNVDFTRL